MGAAGFIVIYATRHPALMARGQLKGGETALVVPPPAAPPALIPPRWHPAATTRRQGPRATRPRRGTIGLPRDLGPGASRIATAMETAKLAALAAAPGTPG